MDMTEREENEKIEKLKQEIDTIEQIIINNKRMIDEMRAERLRVRAENESMLRAARALICRRFNWTEEYLACREEIVRIRATATSCSTEVRLCE